MQTQVCRAWVDSNILMAIIWGKTVLNRRGKRILLKRLIVLSFIRTTSIRIFLSWVELLNCDICEIRLAKWHAILFAKTFPQLIIFIQRIWTVQIFDLEKIISFQRVDRTFRRLFNLVNIFHCYMRKRSYIFLFICSEVRVSSAKFGWYLRALFVRYLRFSAYSLSHESYFPRV